MQHDDDSDIEVIVGLIVSVRSGDVLDRVLYEEAVIATSRIGERYASMLSLPKKVVDVFLDVYPALHAAATYRDESERDTVETWAEDLHQHIKSYV